MQFKVTFKDPDTLYDTIKDEVKRQVADLNLSEAETKLLVEERTNTQMDICKKWFEFGEYLTVEIDTDEKTCKVLTND